MTQLNSESILELPDLSGEYALNESKIADFQQNGHVLLPGLCSPAEAAAYRSVITEATYGNNKETRPMEERDTYSRAFLQIMNLWKLDARVARFTLARRFAKVAAELLQADGVRLYHDQALYKEAGGGHTPWHQDQYYWPIEQKGIRSLTMWMPLVDVTIEMGALTFASKSHTEGFQGHLAISDKSHDEFDKTVKDKGYSVVNANMKAGDATFHSGWTLHCAPGNAGTIAREVMTVIYIAEGTFITEPDNENREIDLKGWLPGQKPGETVGSPLNPLLYSK